jgi:hypothetical protein
VSLKKLGQKAERINIQLLALKEAQANSELIAELNRQQLTVGENSKAQDVGQYVSPRYASFKKRIGSQAPAGVVDLKLSGNLYKGIGAKVTPTLIEIKSTVPYDIYQEKRYGDTIHKLQDQNWEEVETKVLVGTIKKYVKLMGL